MVVDAGGGLDLGKLLSALQAFFREHSEHWVERFQYKEAGPRGIELLEGAVEDAVVPEMGVGVIQPNCRRWGTDRGRAPVAAGSWPPQRTGGATSPRSPRRHAGWPR